MSYPDNHDNRSAVIAGEKALDCLREAKRELRGAGSWGIFDIFGGGMLPKVIKHGKIGNAQICLGESKRCLSGFYRELKELSQIYDVDLGIDEFAVLIDFFLDGSFGDFYMQTKIGAAGRRIDEAIMRVEDALGRIRDL